MALTGDAVDVQEAAEWGLVNVVARPGAALAEAMVLAERVAANAPLSVQYTKRVMHQVAESGSDWDPEWSRREPWSVNDEATAIVFGSRDAVEGPTAFAEKRVAGLGRPVNPVRELVRPEPAGAGAGRRARRRRLA